MISRLYQNIILKILILFIFLFHLLLLNGMNVLISTLLKSEVEQKCGCEQDCQCRRATAGICLCHKTVAKGLSFSAKCACSVSGSPFVVPQAADPYMNNGKSLCNIQFYFSKAIFFLQLSILPEEPIFEIDHPPNLT